MGVRVGVSLAAQYEMTSAEPTAVPPGACRRWFDESCNFRAWREWYDKRESTFLAFLVEATGVAESPAPLALPEVLRRGPFTAPTRAEFAQRLADDCSPDALLWWVDPYAHDVGALTALLTTHAQLPAGFWACLHQGLLPDLPGRPRRELWRRTWNLQRMRQSRFDTYKPRGEELLVRLAAAAADHHDVDAFRVALALASPSWDPLEGAPRALLQALANHWARRHARALNEADAEALAQLVLDDVSVCLEPHRGRPARCTTTPIDWQGTGCEDPDCADAPPTDDNMPWPTDLVQLAPLHSARVHIAGSDEDVTVPFTVWCEGTGRPMISSDLGLNIVAETMPDPLATGSERYGWVTYEQSAEELRGAFGDDIAQLVRAEHGSLRAGFTDGARVARALQQALPDAPPGLLVPALQRRVWAKTEHIIWPDDDGTGPSQPYSLDSFPFHGMRVAPGGWTASCDPQGILRKKVATISDARPPPPSSPADAR